MPTSNKKSGRSAKDGEIKEDNEDYWDEEDELQEYIMKRDLGQIKEDSSEDRSSSGPQFSNKPSKDHAYAFMMSPHNNVARLTEVVGQTCCDYVCLAQMNQLAGHLTTIMMSLTRTVLRMRRNSMLKPSAFCEVMISSTFLPHDGLPLRPLLLKAFCSAISQLQSSCT
jgi:hypothetical protein